MPCTRIAGSIVCEIGDSDETILHSINSKGRIERWYCEFHSRFGPWFKNRRNGRETLCPPRHVWDAFEAWRRRVEGQS